MGRNYRLRRLWGRQDGQGTAEYVGLIALLLAAIVTLSTSAAGSAIASSIGEAVKSAFCALDPGCGGSGGPGGPGEPPVVATGPRRVYDAGNGSDIPGDLIRDEGDGPTGDPEADAVDANFAAIYTYFFSEFGRDSFDDNGAPLIATIRYRQDPDVPYRNAYWDPERRQMVFGEGYAEPLDVTAHEVTHALTDETADLEYRGESGALNESMSDIFGSNLDPDDWTIGEDLPDGAIRDMADPERFDQPAHVDDYRALPDTVDNGGVHINSGIPNHAYFNMVQNIGRDAAQEIVYRALTEHLESDSGFEDFRTASLQVAEDEYGADSPEYEGVDEAFRAVGLDGTWEAPDPDE